MAGADLGVVLLRIARRHVGRVIAGLALRAVQRLLPLVAGNAVTGEAAAAVMAQQLIMSTNARSRQMLRFAIFFIVSSFVPFDTPLSYRNPSQETADNFVRLAKISSVFTASYISIPAFWADCIVPGSVLLCRLRKSCFLYTKAVRLQNSGDLTALSAFIISASLQRFLFFSFGKMRPRRPVEALRLSRSAARHSVHHQTRIPRK